MSAERVTYVDSSAIVKLVVREPESTALRRHLRRRGPLVASALTRTEVARAVLALGPEVLARAADVLARIELVRVSDRVLTAAGGMEPVELRSLDAIHTASAALFGSTLREVITYDRRMAQAAQQRGWTVVAPA